MVAGSLLIIVIFGIPIHLQRFTTKGPYNWISWIHIIIFSFLIYISILAFKKWNQPHEHFKSTEFLVNYKGEQYDIASFVPQHPGGSVIKKAKDKDLETIWKEHGVSWHNDNPRVQQKLAELKNIRVERIAKDSLITEIIKTNELKKFHDFSKANELINIIEKKF